MHDYFLNEILLPQVTFQTSQFASSHLRKPYHFNKNLFLGLTNLATTLANIEASSSQKVSPLTPAL